jgi:hypothetical protein
LLPSEERRTRNEERGTEAAVRTEDIVAYLEKRFAPAPVDERLRLDEPVEVKMQSAECKMQSSDPKEGNGAAE